MERNTIILLVSIILIGLFAGEIQGFIGKQAFVGKATCSNVGQQCYPPMQLCCTGLECDPADYICKSEITCTTAGRRAFNAPGTCTDTTYPNGIKDYCGDKTTIQEYNCISDRCEKQERACPSDYTCENGACYPACSNYGDYKCKNNVPYFCMSNLIWDQWDQCPTGTTCNDETGQCDATTCTDKCSPYRKKECATSTSYKWCRTDYFSGCLDWSVPIPCPSGTCQNDKCITTACTDTSWVPGTSKVCQGESFIQTSNCGNTRQAVGSWTCMEGYECIMISGRGMCYIKQPSTQLQQLGVPIIGKNEKDLQKYSNKGVFLISDNDWHKILPLVPLTTWTGSESCSKGYGTPDNVCVYPTLIYHDESSGFDADSIIYFMQQYSPDKLTVIEDIPQELANLLIAQPELGAGLKQENIWKIDSSSYLSYWKSFESVVYVQGNYELALLASTYASLINAPLIIEGTNLDLSDIFKGRNIICIGSVTPSGSTCSEQYNLEQLQQKYVDETNTDKIILVNYNDLNIKINEQFKPEKSGNYINELYSKTSLSAPILASAKHELIISTASTNYKAVDNFIETKITNLKLNPEYLTIIASPNAIEMSKETNRDYASRKWREEVDNHLYGNLDQDSFQELAVGRIFSLTTSDISSYLARTLFYSETPKDNEFSIIWPSEPSGITGMKIEAVAIEQIFRSMGLNSISFITNQNLPPDASEFKNKFMLTYLDHAYTGGGGYNFNTYSLGLDKVWLNSPLVFMEGCASCAFEVAHTKSELFCANLLRRGAIFHYGATVDVSGTNWDPAKMIVEELLVSENIGQAVKDIRNKATMWGKHWNSFIVPEILQNLPELRLGEYDPYNVLIGDPTFDPNLKKPQLEELTVSFNENLIEINIPEVNKNIKVNYIAHDNLLWRRELFNYPFGNKIGRIFKEYYEVYNNSKLFTFGWADVDLLLFSLKIPNGYKIKDINRIEYIDSSVTKNIMYMPVFESDMCWYGKCEPNIDYILYAKDEGSENIYYFLMYIQYGGDPIIVKTQDVIPQHQFKIYLELEGGI